MAELSPVVDGFVPRLGRASWKPVVAADDGKDLGTRYGGRPWIGFGFAWPTCPSCKKPMQAFVQVDLATLPADFAWPHRDGLIQLFYCTTTQPLCEVDCQAFDAFARSVVTRWIPGERVAASAGVGRVPPGGNERHDPYWRATRVTGWEPARTELPGYEEPAWEDVEAYEERCYELLDVMRARELSPDTGDKLGGWPAWVQSPWRPPCPTCRAPMDVLLQVESNGHCGHQFGDLGAGHITQCASHPASVAFAWACH